MRYLKTKFPCTRCGAPAEVERLRHEKYAICEPCAKRLRAIQRIELFHSAGTSHTTRGNAAATEEELLTEWFQGLSDHTAALAMSVKGLSALGPADRRRVMLRAQSWLKWIRRRLKDLDPRMAVIADETGFPLLDGGLKTPAEADEHRPAVSLTVLKGGA